MAAFAGLVLGVALPQSTSSDYSSTFNVPVRVDVPSVTSAPLSDGAFFVSCSPEVVVVSCSPEVVVAPETC